MGLVSGRVILVLLLLFVGLGIALARGMVSIKGDDYKCYQGRGWYAVGDKQRIVAINKLNFYYQPITFDCPPNYRYSPDTYELKNGVLVPKPDAKPN